MTIVEARTLGPGVDRVDGPLKVTGTAHYPNDFTYVDLAHAVLVRATVPAGRIRRIDPRAAQAAPGVLAVVTHHNAPALGRGPDTPLWRQPQPPLQDDRIRHYGQYVALVAADTAEQATAAARLVDIDYELAEALLDLDDPRAELLTNPWGTDELRGDVAVGMASADVTLEATYTTPDETNNPLGLFATVASWDGDSLTVHDSTHGHTPYARRSRRRLPCPRTGCGCSRGSSAAASARGCGSGRMWSSPRWRPGRSNGRSNWC